MCYHILKYYFIFNLKLNNHIIIYIKIYLFMDRKYVYTFINMYSFFFTDPFNSHVKLIIQCFFLSNQ